MASSFSTPNLGKNTLNFSTGELAKQANGSVVVSFADTVVLATVCISNEPHPQRDFLPLTVDYQERTYAMGKIPGGFIKREGRPKDREMLTSRLIDRPLRPLFPKGLTNEVQIIAMVLSSDGENDPDVLAINGASCAISISDIPFHHPVGAVRVSKLEDKFIVNPTYEERENSSMDLVVVGTEERIVMLEGEFLEAKEADICEAIKFAHPFIKEIINLQKKMSKEVGKKKKEILLSQIDKDLFGLIRDKVSQHLEEMYGLVDKEDKYTKTKNIFSSLEEELITEEAQITEENIKNTFFAVEEEFVRKKILEKEQRPDGRSLKDVRDIECSVGVFPRTHGSGIFTRGQTQALAVTTLGTSSDGQFVESLEGEKKKHFMLHYTFPPFSVGEIKFLRGPSRREIGHGALAEKSLLNVIPSKEDFPYTIRVVSEILESNGSSSMATVCATSLSLMDAGIPIRSAVAGIAIGLVEEGQNYKILTDIAGVEDHYGDMDFKIAGTKDGITAIQLDVKIAGITSQMIEDALQRAHEARAIILGKMDKALSSPRAAVAKYAPKIKSFKIDPEKIGSVIGPGGRIIRRLTREYNVSIDIDDEKECVFVVAERAEDLDRAVNQIMNLVKDIEVGQIYEVKITRLANFGAFCEIVPGKSGLIRISEISDKFVENVGDFLKEDDVVTAMVVNVDPQGKIALSIKQAQAKGSTT